MKPKPLLIVADDLTGAADSAAAGVRAGLTARVVLGHRNAHRELDEHIQVLSVDADTRRMRPAQAAAVNVELLDGITHENFHAYKKIDSTLRGNFIAELLALLPHSPMALIAPAFPDAGRQTLDGHQYLNGVALEHTEIWRHEGMSGRADLPGMLAAHGVRTAAVSLAQVRAGLAQLKADLRECMHQGMQAVVCDAQTNADLRRIALASVALSQPLLWVGSAGLASELAASIGLKGNGCRNRTRLEGPILVVVGSRSSVSHRQTHTLSVNRPLHSLSIRAEMLSGAERHEHWRACQSRIAETLGGGRDVLLSIAEIEGQTDPHLDGTLCQALGRLLEPASTRIGGLVSTGGETSRTLLSAFGSTGLNVTQEVEPGIPLSIAYGAFSSPVITKAGAFGSDGSLVRCYDALDQIRRRTQACGPALLRRNAGAPLAPH